MSRIYDNQALGNLPLINVDFARKWNEESFSSGSGIILEGTIQSRSHIAVTDISKTKYDTKRKNEGKDQESIQSSTTPDPIYQWESDNATTRPHKREPRGQPFQARDTRHLQTDVHESRTKQDRNSINDPQKKHRLGTVHYYIFHLKVNRAHKRKFDGNGKEIEPNFSETKKVNTGYLNSSYRTETKGTSDRLSEESAAALVNIAELATHTSKHAPSNTVSLWIQDKKCEGMEFQAGDSVRVKTQGDSPFIFSIAQMDSPSSTVSNYAGGEAVGGSWTDKIMDVKSSTTIKTNDGDCADDDEWDD